ncbi:MAG: fibronectin type III domain-containing protein [Chloroflexi bacterium]|nr:fibronectin type III domain-containing protein [Chloroflexota bacterium]
MNYGKMKLFSMLMVPLFVVLSFAAAKTTLVQADQADRANQEIESAVRLLGPSVPGSGLAFEATSAVTGSLTITGVAVGNIGATSAQVTWETDNPSNSLVRYGIATDTLTLSATSPVTATAHSVGLTNLTPATQYFLEVESTDADGNTDVDDNGGSLYSFTTVEAAIGQRKAFVGTVVGYHGDTVGLTKQGTGEYVTILLPDGYYSVKTPGGPRAGTFGDGASVVILAKNVGGGWVAIWVLVKPTKPIAPVTGVVTGVGPTSITITGPDGETHLIRLTGQAKKAAEDLEIGEVVTVLRGKGNQAKRLVTANEVRIRMLADIEADGEDEGEVEEDDQDEAEKKFKSKRVDALIRGLERLGLQQLQVLGHALDRGSDDVKIKLRSAKLRIEIRIESARETSKKARIRFKIINSGNSGNSGKNSDGEDNSGPGNSKNRGPSDNRGKASESEGGDSSGKSGNSGKSGKESGEGKGHSGRGGRDSSDGDEENDDDDDNGY